VEEAIIEQFIQTGRSYDAQVPALTQIMVLLVTRLSFIQMSINFLSTGSKIL
jgi:hypothetical protein